MTLPSKLIRNKKIQVLLDRVQNTSEEADLFLKISKTKLMIVENSDNDISNALLVNREVVAVISQFNYLSKMINDQFEDTSDIKRRTNIARNTALSLTSICKNNYIWKNTKER